MRKQKIQFIVLAVILIVCIGGYFGITSYYKNKESNEKEASTIKVLEIEKLHPHKFRRTLATMAIDKGMPIEQLQQLLGHKRIDTTLQYAMVKQSNVKQAHRKYIG